MHISNMILQNFRCIKDGEAILGKITLLTGANSSGKSSFISSILLALQSKDYPYSLTFNGAHANLGAFTDTVHKHLAKTPMTLAFTTTTSNNTVYHNTTWGQGEKDFTPQLIECNIESGPWHIKINKNNRSKNGYKYNITYDPQKSVQPKGAESDTKHDIKMRTIADQLISVVQTLKKGEAQEIFNLNFNNLITLKAQNAALPEIKQLLEHLKFADPTHILFHIINPFKNISPAANFISSFRLAPDRGYIYEKIPDLKTTRYGDNYLLQLMEWESVKSIHLKNIISNMKKLKLASDIKSQVLRNGKFEMKIKTNKSTQSHPLVDVGFGISQFLPILVADEQLGPKSLLIISQPEIHIHPETQSLFGDYLADNAKNKSKQYIIETHSEYLINKIRLLIAQGKLQESDVRTYYLTNRQNESNIIEISLKKSGEIIGAPKEFFKTYMMDTIGIALASSGD